MTKPYGRQDSDGRWTIPAAERNKEPILTVLRDCLPPRGLVLEVASGTGQHIVHFAKSLSQFVWQPSDPDAEFRTCIEHRVHEEGVENVRAPLDLDVRDRPWPVSGVDVVLCVNMIHVAPWEATRALMSGCGDILRDGGVLFLYGPYRRFGAHTSPSNEAFDARLKAENQEWGVRDVEEVERLGSRASLSLETVIEMPANNFSLVFKRRSRKPIPAM